jgi:hypothetical protein
VEGLLKIDRANIKALLGIAVSGYAGADFIENSLSIIIPGAGASAPSQAPATGTNCIEGMTGTSCNVPSSPNSNGGYGSRGGSGSSSGHERPAGALLF